MRIRERLQEILDAFDRDPKAGLEGLRGLQHDGRREFSAAALSALAEHIDPPGHQALARLLAETDVLAEALCDPVLFSRERAIEVARVASSSQPLLDAKLARRLPDLQAESAERVLAILDRIAEGARVAAMMRGVLRGDAPRLRSKAALLVGRANRNPDWLEQQMQDSDARVRANSIEALWGVDLPGLRAQFHQALDDPDPRVCVNALVGLYYLGDTACLPRIRARAMKRGVPERAGAAWAMSRIADPRFLPLLHSMDRLPLDRVGRHVDRAIEQIEKAQARTRPPLSIRLLRRGVAPDGAVQLQIAATGVDWGLIDVPATGFIVWEGGDAVEEYTARVCDRRQSLVIGFSLCGGMDFSLDEVEAARAALLPLVDRKRQGDSWAVVRQSDHAVRFSTDRLSLKKALAQADPTDLVARAKNDAVSRLAERAGELRGDRHLIVLAGPQDIPSGLLAMGRLDAAALVAAAKQRQCAIHAVVLGQPVSPHPLQPICADTGGSFVTAGPSCLRETYQSVLCGLLNRYDISYHPVKSGLPARLEIFSELGSGEIPLG